MSDENKAAADLAPRSWRNYTRSHRARELRSDLVGGDESLEVTEWWLEDDNDERP